jgi:hypothetical protein
MTATDIFLKLTAAKQNGWLSGSVSIPNLNVISRWAIQHLGTKPVNVNDKGEHVLVPLVKLNKPARLFSMRNHEHYAGLGAKALGAAYDSGNGGPRAKFDARPGRPVRGASAKVKKDTVVRH